MLNLYIEIGFYYVLLLLAHWINPLSLNVLSTALSQLSPTVVTEHPGLLLPLGPWFKELKLLFPWLKVLKVWLVALELMH